MGRDYTLALYVSDHSAASRRALEAVERLQAEHADLGWDVSVIDVLGEPLRAAEARIIATPTLVRVAPAPERRVVGSLDDHERVLQVLDIPADPADAGTSAAQSGR